MTSPIPTGQFLADLGFKITKVLPPMLLNDLGNALTAQLHDLGVCGHKDAPKRAATILPTVLFPVPR